MINNRKNIALAATAFLCASALSGCAEFRRVPVAAGSVNAPDGYVDLCASHADACAPVQRKEIHLDSETMAIIERENRDVNLATKWTDGSGAPAYWMPASSGDCKTIAVNKKINLVRAGIPASALRFATVQTRDGIGHVVLTVDTDQGALVLDNLDADVKFANEPWYSHWSMELGAGKFSYPSSQFGMWR